MIEDRFQPSPENGIKIDMVPPLREAHNEVVQAFMNHDAKCSC
jgi:hypothetical protein